jgi:Co/Zn/Cd efflux system component
MQLPQQLIMDLESNNKTFVFAKHGIRIANNPTALLQSLLARQETNKIIKFVGVLLLMSITEVTYASSNGSLGLLADAVHTIFHAIALFIACVGITLSHAHQHSGTKYDLYSFGYERFEVLATFANSIFLIFVCGFVIAGALSRLVDPFDMDTDRCVCFAAAALAHVSILSTWSL